ncbi:MAG: winged helix-turn-helix domain-containing protein [Rickettsiaceae bacterium]|nr:winged helix-turn-helix domain-containing protein [Rickettsiaceae bacterium]
MAGISKAINDALYNKVTEALNLVSKSGDVSRKLQAIKSAKTHGVSKVAEIFDISRVALMKWIKSFSEHGIKGLKLKEGRGRKPPLTDSETNEVKKLLEQDHNLTIKAMRIKIQELFSKTLSKSTVHNIIKKLGFSYLTPRPRHYKKDKSAAEEFKKKSATEIRTRSI